MELNIGSVGYLATTVLSRSPELLALLAGMILCLVTRRRVGGRRAGFGFAGFAVLLLVVVASALYGLLLPSIVQATSVRSLGPISLVVTLALSLLGATGVGLLIAAVTSRHLGEAGAGLPDSRWPDPRWPDPRLPDPRSPGHGWPAAPAAPTAPPP